MGSDLRLTVARVCIMAAEQGVNSTNGLFMKEENPVGEKISVFQTVLKKETLII